MILFFYCSSTMHQMYFPFTINCMQVVVTFTSDGMVNFKPELKTLHYANMYLYCVQGSFSLLFIKTKKEIELKNLLQGR